MALTLLPRLLSGWLILDLIPHLHSPLGFPSLHFPLGGGCRSLQRFSWLTLALCSVHLSFTVSIPFFQKSFFLFPNILFYSQVCRNKSSNLTENSFFLKSLH